MREPHHASLEYQQRAIQAWWQELDRRFTTTQMQTPINEVPLSAAGRQR